MTRYKLQALLRENEITHFSAAEITLQRQWNTHAIPDAELWQNIIPTLQLAEAIRMVWASVVDEPSIRVNSGLRLPEYNEERGGSLNSEHLVFKALDLSPTNGQIDMFQDVVQAVVGIARSYGTNVGLGLYKTFIHIDTNAEGKPRNRTWDMR